ncbi:MAG: amidase [Myxococcota bacterium]
MHPMDIGAVALARAIRSRDVSSEEAVGLCLDRIAARDPQLAAFVEVHGAPARKEARKKDAKGSEAPFHGVPIAVKDLNFVRFRTTRFGGRGMPAIWSPMDDVSVSRLRAAGFVILGKTATSELGVVPITEPVGRPPTRNPWDLGRTPGGSSGGAGAAVAAGLVPVAHGSDGGGSIRIPASFCGLVGLKASRGCVPNHLGLSDPDVIYTCGALARNVDDAEAMLRVQGATVGPAKAGPLRIRMLLDVPLLATDPHVRAAVEDIGRVLAAAGHHVEEATAPLGDVDDFLPIWQHLIGNVGLLRASRAEPVTRWLAETGRKLDKGFVRRRHAELSARWSAWLDGCDVVLTPTVGVPPPAVDAYPRDDGEQYFRQAALLGVWTAPFNVTGQPAMSVPVGLHPIGTPIGAQLAGPLGSEATLLALARTIEAERPFEARAKGWTEG